MLLFINKMLDRLIFNTCVLVWSFNKSRSVRSHTSYRHKSPHPSVKKGEGVGDRTLRDCSKSIGGWAGAERGWVTRF